MRARKEGIDEEIDQLHREVLEKTTKHKELLQNVRIRKVEHLETLTLHRRAEQMLETHGMVCEHCGEISAWIRKEKEEEANRKRTLFKLNQRECAVECNKCKNNEPMVELTPVHLRKLPDGIQKAVNSTVQQMRD